jgi:hypothetical protein
LITFLLAGPLGLAQERFGEINGAVTDASGAAAPNATVTLTNKTTGRVITLSTGNDGSYAARHLDPGRHGLRIEAKAFSVFEVPDVNPLAGKTLTDILADSGPKIATQGTFGKHLSRRLGQICDRELPTRQRLGESL